MEKKTATNRYFEGVGRRKTAVARVRISKGAQSHFTVNEVPYTKFFQAVKFQKVAHGALDAMKLDEKFSISAKVLGGGVKAQAEAVRHGVARALAKFEPELVKRLRAADLLTRDPRMVERKKYGLRKARRAPQWAKR